MADYSQLPTLITDAKREALIAEMTCNGWDFEDNAFKKFANYGESSAGQVVTLDGQASGYSYGGGASNDNDTGLAQAALNEFTEVKSKWDSQIDELVDGWDRIEDPVKYDALIASMGAATKKVAGGTGGDDSTLGNPDLTEIGFIRERLAQNAGQTVEQFYRLYGPEKLELVLDGHCEVMACLGLAVAGEKEIWTKTRVDVPTILEAAVTGFTQTRQNNSADWPSLITVATAGVGVLSAFTVGVPGLAPILAAVSATGGFLGSALDTLPKKSEDKTTYSGSHPDAVYADLKTAYTLLQTNVAEQEQGLDDMLSVMLTAIGDGANRANFHIHPAAGLGPEFGGTDDVIDMQFQVLETIGYTSMPLIAKAFLESVDNAAAADQVGVWFRPWASVPGGSIGQGGGYGPFYTWQNLYRAVFPLMNDTAAEVVRAGEHLAEAAGYVRDSDDSVKQTLGDNYQDIKDADLGWQAPYTPPPPPPYRGDHRHNIQI